MATPMTPAQVVTQLKKWDVPYREVGDWRNHNRDDETGLVFGPVYGGIQHHTGDDAPDSIDREIIRNGRTGLPGPLSQVGTNDDGMLDLIGWGRANHAGGGDPDVLRAVINESYGDYPPPPDKHTGEAGAVDGNDRFYGNECYYSGSHRMTPAAYATIVKWWAAVCDFHGWTAKSIIGHKEWSDWKIDPGYLDMKVLRFDIQTLLTNGPSTPAPPPPKPLPPRIVKALEATRDYQRVLQQIQHPKAQDEVELLIRDIKRHRRLLRTFTIQREV